MFKKILKLYLVKVEDSRPICKCNKISRFVEHYLEVA